MKMPFSLMKTLQQLGFILGLLSLTVQPSSLFAQQLMETIEVDSVTRSPKKNLPYHMPFVLKIPMIEEPKRVRLYKHRVQSNQADMELRSFINHERMNKKHYLTDGTFETDIEVHKTGALTALSEVSEAYFKAPNPSLTQITFMSKKRGIMNSLQSIKKSNKRKFQPRLKYQIRTAKHKTKRAFKFLKNSPQTKDYVAFRKIEKARLAINRIGLDDNYIIIPESNIQFTKEKNQGYLLIKFGDVPGDPTFSEHLFLDPNKNYSLYFETPLKGYQKLIDLYKDCFDDSSKCSQYNNALENSTEESNYSAITHQRVQDDYNKVSDIYAELIDKLNKLTHFPEPNNEIIQCLQEIHIAEECCDYDEEVKKQITFLNTLVNWIAKEKLNDLAKGILNFDNGKSVDRFSISDRSANLELMEKKLQAFQEANQLYTFFPRNTNCVNQFIPEFRLCIQENLSLLKEPKTLRSEITEQIQKSAPYISYNSLTQSPSLTTNIFQFDSRTSSHIVADFGFGYYGAVGNEERRKLFSGITPYLGFSVSPWPFNKSMPFRMYPRHIKRNPVKRLAINVGWTTTKLSRDESTRDFFESGSLILGVSFHLSHTLKLTYGRTLFYQENINPLVEKRSLTSTAFIGLTIDISLKNAFNTLSSLVTSRAQ
jgi:hypothetical protein